MLAGSVKLPPIVDNIHTSLVKVCPKTHLFGPLLLSYLYNAPNPMAYLGFNAPSDFMPVEWVDEELIKYLPSTTNLHVSVMSRNKVDVVIEQKSTASIYIKFNTLSVNQKSYLSSQISLSPDKRVFMSQTLDKALKKEIEISPASLGDCYKALSHLFTFHKVTAAPAGKPQAMTWDDFLVEPTDEDFKQKSMKTSQSLSQMISAQTAMLNVNSLTGTVGQINPYTWSTLNNVQDENP